VLCPYKGESRQEALRGSLLFVQGKQTEAGRWRGNVAGTAFERQEWRHIVAATQEETAAGNCNITVTIVIGWLSGSLSTYNKKVVVPIKPQEICKDSLTGVRDLN